MPLDEPGTSGANALNMVIRTLSQLDVDTRNRVLRSVAMFFQEDGVVPAPSTSGPSYSRPIAPNFSNEEAPSPKQFLFNKQPKTDVERIACLGFYLTHYRDQPHFKTLDLAKLNTEAAQPKFSNDLSLFPPTTLQNRVFLYPPQKANARSARPASNSSALCPTAKPPKKQCRHQS